MIQRETKCLNFESGFCVFYRSGCKCYFFFVYLISVISCEFSSATLLNTLLLLWLLYCRNNYICDNCCRFSLHCHSLPRSFHYSLSLSQFLVYVAVVFNVIIALLLVCQYSASCLIVFSSSFVSCS